ncbi:MAG: sulfurtransferase, partial [Gammaproteobacteria bacterium]|nr:sulfurtransferase [Gammaproteobacteria bacterium]
VIDCRFYLSDVTQGRREYAEGHVPGAVFMDLNADLASVPDATTGRHPLPAVEAIAAKIGRLGIDNRSNVVVYDTDTGAMAARCWWIFRWLGHSKVQLLDGGLAAWRRSGLPVSSNVPAPNTVNFIARPKASAVIGTNELEGLIGTDNMPTVFDARDTGRFAGMHEPIDPVAGHVPGARNLPYTESLAADGRWKSPTELEALWRRYLGDGKETRWVAMCGSGVTACHLALSALEAGYAEPRLYAGSWSEWIRDRRRPVETGAG